MTEHVLLALEELSAAKAALDRAAEHLRSIVYLEDLHFVDRRSAEARRITDRCTSLEAFVDDGITAAVDLYGDLL